MVPETCETGVMRVKGLVRNHTTSRRWIEIKRAQSVVDYVNGTGYLREDPGELWERPDLKSGRAWLFFGSRPGLFCMGVRTWHAQKSGQEEESRLMVGAESESRVPVVSAR